MRLGRTCFWCFWIGLAIIFCGLTQKSYAQQDRSYRIITNQNALLGVKADTQRVKILNQLAEDLQYSDGFKSLGYARDALAVAQRLRDSSEIARSQRNMGDAYYRLKNFNRAPVFLQQSLVNYQQLNDKKGQADVLNSLAAVYIEENPTKAEDYINSALKIAREENYGKGQMMAYQNRGKYYVKVDDGRALGAFQKSLDTPTDSTQNPLQKAEVYRAMGDYEKKKKEYDKALEYYQQELKVRDKAGDKVGLTESLKNVGLLHQRYKKDDEKALEYFFQSFVVAKDYNDQFDGQRQVNALEGIVDSYGTLAEKTQDEGKLAEARRYRQLYKAYKGRLEAVKNNPKNTKVKTVYVPKYITKTVTIPGPIRNVPSNVTPMPESQRIRLLEIQKRRLAIDNMLKSKRIGVLEAAKKRAELINQEDSIRLSQKDKTIDALKKDTSSKAEKITNLTKQKQQVEEEKNQRLWWLLGLALLALLIVLFLLYRKRQVKKKAEKEIEFHKNKSINRINSQEREINEQRATLQKQADELDIAKIQLEEVTKEKDGLNKVLQEDITPPMKKIVELTTPGENENINRAMVYQSGVQVMNLLTNVEKVQTTSNETGAVVLHTDNHSIYKVSRSALDKVSDLVKEQDVQIDNQIKPFFYATFDYEVLERVFLNFFANALKYTPKGGKIILNAQPVTQDDKDVLEVVFRDNGNAVPEDKLHRVFDDFPPEEARPAGSTWAFNKMMIEAHGGKVEVLPADEGLHVTFTLPDAKSLEDVDYSDLLGIKATTSELDLDIENIALSAEEKATIEPFLKEFAQLEYFETSALKAVLNKIDPQGNTNLTKWKKSLERAVLYLDEESYQKLTQQL